MSDTGLGVPSWRPGTNDPLRTTVHIVHTPTTVPHTHWRNDGVGTNTRSRRD
jgi:hypothetical protein